MTTPLADAQGSCRLTEDGPAPETATAGTQRYEFLDSLRGIAILGVVLTHVGQNIADMPEYLAAFARCGLRGVQLFFMVSALTLCLVTKPETFNPTRFYIRRFFRIAPMFYIAAVFYLLCPALFGVDFAPNAIRPIDGVMTFLFLHGLNPHGINNVVPGGWSIASEAIFYLMFPLLLRRAEGPVRWFAILIGSMIIATINGLIPGLAGLHDRTLADFFHFNIFSNLPAFATGIFLYSIFRARGFAAPSRRVTTTVICGLIAACVLIGCASSRIKGDQMLMLPVLGGLVYIAATAGPAIFVNKILSMLGEISFSIYLVHFAVLHALGDLDWTHLPPTGRLMALYGLTLAASSCIAWVCYRFVERPMIGVGHRLSDRFRSAIAPEAAR